MSVLDGAVAVFCGVAGVQPQSETVWRQATKYKVPRIAFVNKMDRTGANFENALNDMRKKLNAYAYPVVLPIGAEDAFEGVIDIVNQKAITWGAGEVVREGLEYEITEIPDALKEKAQLALAELVDAVSNKDEEIANLVIGDQPVEPLVLKAAIRRLTCRNEFVPVLCGSAFKKKGVQVLVDAVVDYLPCPLDIPSAEGTEPGTDQVVEVEADDNGKFCSLAFKLWTDIYAGKLVFFRVYSGQLKKGDTIYNPRTRKRDRVSRLMIIQGSERKDVDAVYSGDIAALVGLRNIITGDTLCDEDFDVMLFPPTFPEPVISMAVEPKTKADREKLGEGLQRLAEEDPTFRCFTNEETEPVDHRRDGRVAPGDHRGQAQARVQGGRRDRRAANRLPGNHHRPCGGRGQVHQAIGRPGPIRPCLRQGRAQWEGQGRGDTQQDRGRDDSQGIHSADH